MRALEASNGGTIDDKKNAFQSGKNLGGEAGHSGEGIFLGGRKIFVDPPPTITCLECMHTSSLLLYGYPRREDVCVHSRQVMVVL